MTQAPTPGPLSGDDDMKLLIAHTIIEDLRAQHPGIKQIDNERGDIWLPGGSTPQSSGCIVDIHSVAQAVEHEVRASLSPTAPVEASGSERDRLKRAIADGISNGYEQYDDASPAQRERYDMAAEAVLNLRPQPSGFLETLTDEQRIAALSHTGGDTHPQPSGETREAVAEIIEAAIVRHDPAIPLDSTLDDADRILALIRPAPVASGGQHSSGEDAEVLAMLDEYADRYIGATRGEDMSLEEMLISKARERLSVRPSPVAETAGEAVAWLVQWKAGGKRRVVQRMPHPSNHAAMNITPLYAAPVPAQDDDKLDAERFRALTRCGRIKMQGSSGVDPHTLERNGNNVHFGAEFWPEPYDPAKWETTYGASTRWGRACLRHLADAVIETEALAALKSTPAQEGGE